MLCIHVCCICDHAPLHVIRNANFNYYILRRNRTACMQFTTNHKVTYTYTAVVLYCGNSSMDRLASCMPAILESFNCITINCPFTGAMD